MTTAETLTDAQIEALSTEAGQAGDLDMVRTCQTALGRFESNARAVLRATTIADARSRVVAAIRDAEASK